MRTTITIPDDLLKKTLKIAKRRSLSEAVTVVLKDYIELQERLELLTELFKEKTPHDLRAIKKQRKKSKWH